MLYSLIRLKNTLVVIPHSGRNEISILVNQTIEKTVSGLDNEKYIKELGSLNFSTRNGIPGIALIHQKLYEQTGDLKYKNEYTSLLNRFVPQDLINGFRYDYSNPLQTNEQSLGLLQGISGLLLTAVELEIQP
jgi:lantibiotic modifying enzyme